MRGLGLVGLVAAVVCLWVFVGTAARADAGGTSRISRRSRRWLTAAVGFAAVSLVLVAVDVARLWS